MTVYVDNMFGNPSWGKWAGGGHMTADTIEELCEMAESIGLKSQWLQTTSGKPMPHFDLTKSKRLMALKQGAIHVDPRDQAALSLRLGGSELQPWAVERIANLNKGAKNV